MKRIIILVLSVFLLPGFTGCGNEQAVSLGPQEWEGLQFVVESRPSPIRVGMNEFIVIASRDEYKPGVGLVVSLQVSKEDKWRQAIQDGFTGVYRRAVRVTDPQRDVLAVHVRKGEEAETTLYFPFGQAD
jgi:hypothetical protein